MAEIKHEGYVTYNKHKSGQNCQKKRLSFSLHHFFSLLEQA